ncbi:hypothetical protein B0J11DRAFT_537853 [Dendryphion nanum]|uniref:NAD(P)-binding protein n=1 Tax=Dendryphion nanum TaxID=256645 RepID=A0A9P9DCX7_9PLEO|nr:hypothetical protein B0J11DRAFT_537853 [Dendryphion nanum]
MRPWTLVSPASRGIGFALTRHLLQTTRAPVVATARKDLERTKEELLDGLENVDRERLTVLELDVLEESTIASASSRCAALFSPKNNTLQLSFLVPGILYPEKSPAQIDATDALLTFRTNTLGPMLMLKHFSGFLPKKQKSSSPPSQHSTSIPSITAVMSARVGSISDNHLGGWYSYRASKAGVNQVVKTFDNFLRTRSGDAAVAVGLHPGTVRTGLSKEFWGSVREEKLFERQWVAERLVRVVGGLWAEGRRNEGDVVAGRERDGDMGPDGSRERVLEMRGRCWDWDGKEVPP